MKTEAEFRKHVTETAEHLGGFVSNIESHLTSAGIPDSCIYLNCVDIWLELKVVASSGAGGVKMRPSQKKWHMDRYEKGGRSWVMVWDSLTGCIGLVPGHIAAVLPQTLTAWTKHCHQFPIGDLAFMLNKITEYTKNDQQHASDSLRATLDPGSPRPALSPSLEALGGHHWLTSKR